MTITNRYGFPDLQPKQPGFAARVSAYVASLHATQARVPAPTRAAAAPPAPPSPPAKRRPLEEIEADLEALERRLRREHPEYARELDRQAGIQPRQLDSKSAARAESRRQLDIRMGLVSPTAACTIDRSGTRLSLGGFQTASERLATAPAKPAKASPPVASAQAPEAAAELRRKMGVADPTPGAVNGVLATPYRLSLGVR